MSAPDRDCRHIYSSQSEQERHPVWFSLAVGLNLRPKKSGSTFPHTGRPQKADGAADLGRRSVLHGQGWRGRFAASDLVCSVSVLLMLKVREGCCFLLWAYLIRFCGQVCESVLDMSSWWWIVRGCICSRAEAWFLSTCNLSISIFWHFLILAQSWERTRKHYIITTLHLFHSSVKKKKLFQITSINQPQHWVLTLDTFSTFCR